uniref:Uncharacterized protein n=1 Tax=Rhodosorus marinus TaxID=101924 RepID=A0A7S0BPJ6_9RHOD|mmetsp:Transcript_281/g.291  ORF Transcript_281/g.291 Transcript_281/m.291 type:complete len:100 (+) Transcript_281:417-716(+)
MTNKPDPNTRRIMVAAEDFAMLGTMAKMHNAVDKISKVTLQAPVDEPEFRYMSNSKMNSERWRTLRLNSLRGLETAILSPKIFHPQCSESLENSGNSIS